MRPLERRSRAAPTARPSFRELDEIMRGPSVPTIAVSVDDVFHTDQPGWAGDAIDSLGFGYNVLLIFPNGKRVAIDERWCRTGPIWSTIQAVCRQRGVILPVEPPR